MTRTLDIAGTEMTVPDPDEITGLSGRFQAMGDALADAQDRLSALASAQDWNQWTGPAATAFGQSAGELPGQLGTAQESYHEVASALSDYADQLRPVVAALSSLAAQADEAAGNLTAVQAAQDQSVLQTGPGLDPALAGLGPQVTAARAVVEQIQARARSQQSELITLANRCVTRISAALPDHKQHQGLLGDLGALGHGVLHTADGLIVKPFTELPGEVKKLSGDFSWANIGKALGDLSEVLGILAFIPVVDAVAAPAALVVGGLAAGADYVALRKHEKGVTDTDVAFAAGGALLGGAGRVADGAADAARALPDGADAQVSGAALLKAGVKHLVDFSDVKASLSSAASRVKESLGDESSGVTVPSGEQAQAALNKASGIFTERATKALHLGVDADSAGNRAATDYQRAAFLTTRAGEAATVTQDQLNEADPSQAPGSDR